MATPHASQAVLGFGSNLGARRSLITAALALLSAEPGLRVLARSPLYETPPLGPPQPDYLNAAARVSWCGSLEALLALTQHVERLLGRERNVRWGARTLDIDLLYWSGGRVQTPWLTVPHPGLLRRNFALAPLLDVLPERRAAWKPQLDALGGAPREACPGWLDPDANCTSRPDATNLEAAELACLGASAVGACAQPPARALTTLAFAVPCAPFDKAQRSFFGPLMRASSDTGFRPSSAAITSVSGSATRGYLIGEHTGMGTPFPASEIRLERAAVVGLTLWVSQPGYSDILVLNRADPLG